MQVALYARVSTANQQQEGTIASQLSTLRQFIAQHSWSLLPEHEFLDEGFSGGRLDRPGLDRLRDTARRGEFDAIVVLCPDRLARNYAHQWLLVEEMEKLQLQWIFLQNPFGDSPQGKLLTQMQGMMAEYERAQILERTRRGRLEKARRGEFMPWAYRCFGYHYLPKRYDSPPQVVIEPAQAETVRRIYAWLVEEQLTCRQIAKRLNQARLAPPAGTPALWCTASVRNVLTNRSYTGQARYNYRAPRLPGNRKTDVEPRHQPQTGRCYHPESEWVWSPAPAIIPEELFAKAQEQLRRNAALSFRRYQPVHRRYLLRCLVRCGDCGLAMHGTRQLSQDKKYEHLYYGCKGMEPLCCGRATKCPSGRVRADRLDEVVWRAVCELLRHPRLLPQLHENWAGAKGQKLASLSAQQEQLLRREGQLQRQDQRLLDAYQTESINLAELQSRRRKLAAELAQVQQQGQQLARAQQETQDWQHIVDHAESFGALLGQNLDRLSFQERQVVVQCLIRQVVVTGEQVDIYYALPFVSAPQVCHAEVMTPAGASGGFYVLRLAHRRAFYCRGALRPAQQKRARQALAKVQREERCRSLTN